MQSNNGRHHSDPFQLQEVRTAWVGQIAPGGAAWEAVIGGGEGGRQPGVGVNRFSRRSHPPRPTADARQGVAIGAQHSLPVSTSRPPPPPPAPLNREALHEALLASGRKESALASELTALRTRRRQLEQRAINAAKAAATVSPHAARLRDDLLAIQRQRERLAEKTRELELQRTRVRPKDIATLQRAKELMAKTQGGVDEARRQSAGEVEAAQARVERLARQQRDRLETSHRQHASLLREQIEGRVLREELATVMTSDS